MDIQVLNSNMSVIKEKIKGSTFSDYSEKLLQLVAIECRG